MPAGGSTPVVSVAAFADGVEGGTDAVLRFTRTGSLGSSLTANYSISGTATSGTDYTALSGTVTFATNSATADVTVAVTDDSTSEPTETVVATVTAGNGYLPDLIDATVNIFDNDAQYVSVVKVADAVENGATGTAQFSRIGDLSSSLTVNYSVAGTATSVTDYTALSGTVTFAANAATANVTVTAAVDAIYDPDETVTVTVGSGAGYSAGAADTAEVAIKDDIETVETTIHEESFQLYGSNGNVDVTLTVTFNAPGAAGLYTWSYVVSNPSSNTSSWSTFSVPIDGMDTDVGNLTSSNGWTGTVGTDTVSWAAGTTLAPGASATFAFTTDPREVGTGNVEVTGAGGSILAERPVAPAPKPVAAVPTVNVNFTNNTHNYTLNLSMTVSQGSGLASGNMPVFASIAATARDFVMGFLKDNDWAVEKAGDNGIRIRGKVLANGTIVAVKSLNWKITNNTSGSAIIEGFGPVTITNN